VSIPARTRVPRPARTSVAALGVVLAAAALAGPVATPGRAGAQTAVGIGSGFFGLPEGTRLVAGRTFPVRVTGSVTVAFRSDPATCARSGRCGLDGVVRWRPGADSGQLVAVATRTAAGRPGLQVFTFLPGAFGGDGDDAGTAAEVRRAVPGGSRVCTDRARGFADLGGAGTDAVEIAPFGGAGADVLATRCAGPRAADVAPVLPTVRLDRTALLRGRRTLDLRADRPFTAAGFTGTVASTVRIVVGAPGAERPATARADRTGARSRVLNVTYAVEAVRGRLTADQAGTTQPARCALLDACGASGTTTVRPRRATGRLRLVASAPLRTPRGRLRAALGLGGGSAAGVRVVGFGGFEGRARVEAALKRPDGARCTDAGSREVSGGLDVAARGGRLRVALQGDGALGLEGPLAGRCGGATTDASEPAPLAAPLPAGALRARRLALRFTRTVGTRDDVFATTLRPDLTVVLRRVGVRETVERLGDDG
jgi:hypothetical protein